MKIQSWIGITGTFLLLSSPFCISRTWAAPAAHDAPRAFNPFTGAPNQPRSAGAPPPSSAHMPHGEAFFDDDDDFDDDFYPMPGGANPGANGGALGGSPYGAAGNPSALHNSGSQNPSHSSRTYSAGGTSNNNVPDPSRSDKGISVGGTSANGVISKGKVDPIKIDDETAEGSKDIVTDFNFPNADIMDIAKTLGKLTGKNFIFDKDVKGTATIVTNSPITVSEAWKVFLTALDINGFALIPSGKYLRIARQRDARDKQLKTYVGEYSPDTDALISRVFQLKYISAEEVARTFRSFMPANSRIIPYEQTNTVIVTDTGSNIAKLAKMLEILDVEGFDAGIEVVPVKYASAAELAKLIDTLVPGTSTGAPGGGPPGAPRFGGGKFNARRTKEGGIINTIVPDERTNTLIVHANTKGADQVRELVAKLDQKLPSSTGGGKVHVVYLQFADAEQIANTLNNFSSQSASGRPPGAAGPGGGTGVNPISNALFEGSIKISPDKSTNALVITASPTDFVTVRRVINKLDIPRDQVYVEVVIMEVSLSNGTEFSANIVSAPSMMGSITNGDLFSFLQNPLGSSGGLIGFPIGKDANLTVNGQTTQIKSVMGLVRALQSATNSNILATPQIIALDNSEALFESSEKVPMQGATTITPTGLAQPSIQREPIVLSIKIKPQINKVTNFVKLDVTTKLGDVSNANVPAALANISFSSLDRTATTTVVVGDSDTIVLGGLIRDKISDTVRKVPILGDIPLLGWLFNSKVTQSTKSNLLIFMTPHIIKQYEKVRAILDKKLKERDDFIEYNAGGEDLLRRRRDSIIQSLPDIKELSKRNPFSSAPLDEDDKNPAAIPINPDLNTTPMTTVPGMPPAPQSVSPGAPLSPTMNPEGRTSPPSTGTVTVPSSSSQTNSVPPSTSSSTSVPPPSPTTPDPEITPIPPSPATVGAVGAP